MSLHGAEGNDIYMSVFRERSFSDGLCWAMSIVRRKYDTSDVLWDTEFRKPRSGGVENWNK
jgi:hypothetical protein